MVVVDEAARIIEMNVGAALIAPGAMISTPFLRSHPLSLRRLACVL